MSPRLLRTLFKHTTPVFARPSFRRSFQNVPFHDDLTPADDDVFGLGDFQHYKDSPEVRAHRVKTGDYHADTEPFIDEKGSQNGSQNGSQKGSQKESSASPENKQNHNLSEYGHDSSNKQHLSANSSFSSLQKTFKSLCVAKQPVAFVSKVSDPYLNLAIEDYIYNQMPLPRPEERNTNRLMFYVNSACVVVGKNQNPWREVNLPLLTDLKIPLVRRRSGGGTVVHDFGNVNYSFMTKKEDFDRFTFANLVVKAVNSLDTPHKIKVNERGDIVTENGNLKVSGSAYKLSRGKSYHHGTMLLNSRLDVLRKLLHRDETQLGHVHSPSAVASVKSPVTNIGISNEAFISAVTREFQHTYGLVEEKANDESMYSTELNQTELFGLQGFVDAFSERHCEVFTIDETTELPSEIHAVKDELRSWEWRFGATPKFQHRFYHEAQDLHVTIDIDKKGVVAKVQTEGPKSAQEAFGFLKQVVDRGDVVEYRGSDVAGFVIDDELSDWIGNAIDGTS